MYDIAKEFGDRCHNCGEGCRARLHAVGVSVWDFEVFDFSPDCVTVLCDDCMTGFVEEHFKEFHYVSYLGVAFDPDEAGAREAERKRKQASAAERVLGLFDGFDAYGKGKASATQIVKDLCGTTLAAALSAVEAEALKRWPPKPVRFTSEGGIANGAAG